MVRKPEAWIDGDPDGKPPCHASLRAMLNLIGLLLTAQVATQVAPAPTDPPDRVHNALMGQTTVRMPQSRTADVEIDGMLNEEVWQTAMLLTGFSQYAPADGRPAPDSTEVLIWYSPTAIYFGIRAFEPHGEVRATMADRDRIDSDDRIELHLDTFLEKRKAFVFIVNPFGVQADGMKSEGGGYIPGANIMPGQNDLSADFQWQSRGRLTDDGYEVEVRIPFNSLRFPATRVQQWGIQIVRHVQHSGYEHTWTPARRASASFIAQGGILDGLTDLHHGFNIALNPELTNTILGAPQSTGGNAWSYTSTPRAGGNIRAALGSNFVLNGTIRPDFSQVEADATQVAADQRFALFYPERRPFFVEGSDQFNVPNTLVYTRQIVRPDAALKLTGRVGRTNVALMSALDAPREGADPEAKDTRPLVDILRLSRDFAQQSTAGFLYSERVSRERQNRTAGADLRHVFGLHFIEFQVAGSRTGGDGLAASDGMLWSGAIDRTGRAFGFNYSLLGISPGFSSDNGFVARKGFVRTGMSNRITLFGSNGGFFEKYNVFFSGNSVWGYDDFFDTKSSLEGSLSMNNSFTFRGGWSLSMSPEFGTWAFDPAAFSGFRLSDGEGSEAAFVPAPRVNSAAISFGASTPRYRRFNASMSIRTGNGVDFLETNRVRRTTWSTSIDLRPTERLRIGATYASDEMTRQIDGLSSFSTSVPRVRLEYQVARPFFIRLVSQYEASRREPFVDWKTGNILLRKDADGNWVPAVRNVSNVLRSDLLFSYRPRPGTVFFAGYGSGMTEEKALSFRGLERASDSFFIKASYFWESHAGQR